ncbi:MAG: ATP-binding cassette domain-containing protein [Chloroflexota bacterium]|nr:ATP-binding cassette domain-containing protein [Chloroflexota bacterium]
MAELDAVTYRYPSAAGPAFAEVSWQVAPGEFVVVAGGSGSGKSTLLRCLNGLVPHFAGGQLGGTVTVAGHDVRRRGPRTLSRSVGFVFQDPETQLLTGRVDDEIAFSLEQHGVGRATLRTRVEEMLDLLGIAALRTRDPATLSGGERQRVAIAAALALHPRLLVLDEPTSQLDPWGAEDVLSTLARLNEELGLTVVLAEHRLDRVLPYADRLRSLGRAGETAIDGLVRDVVGQLDPAAMPPVTRLGLLADWQPLPLSIKEARPHASILHLPTSPDSDSKRAGDVAFELKGVTLAHGRTDVLDSVDLAIHGGEFVALMGRNGSGKTTLLRALAGFHRPRRGEIQLFGRDVTTAEPAEIGRTVGYLPQQPGTLLFSERARDEVRFTLAQRRTARATSFGDEDGVLERFALADVADRHPRDLSGGERERLALAAVLAGGPPVLLLDEPTRGMDAWRKAELGEMLQELAAEGVAVLLASHDVELVARYATRVVLLGGGEIVADAPTREVLAGSLTFSPQINKLLGGGWLTVDEVLAARDVPTR